MFKESYIEVWRDRDADVPVATGNDWHCWGFVEAAVGAFERGNWRGNGSGLTLVRA
jgi:hypothetical protein